MRAAASYDVQRGSLHIITAAQSHPFHITTDLLPENCNKRFEKQDTPQLEAPLSRMSFNHPLR
jgi:hypothetical protein